MKIIEYPRIDDLKATDVFILDGAEGTRGINASVLADALPKTLTPDKRAAAVIDLKNMTRQYDMSQESLLMVGDNIRDGVRSISAMSFFHSLYDAITAREGATDWSGCIKRSVFRGKYLGDNVTDGEWENIANGTFKGLFVGDYWNIGGINWRIADFNYWSKDTGDTNTKPHVVIWPDQSLTAAEMNDTPTTVGGYIGSKMWTDHLPNKILPMIDGIFGADHIYEHRGYFINAVTDGVPSGGIITYYKVDLPSELMLYGAKVHGNETNTKIGYNVTHDTMQMAISAIYPSAINLYSEGYWLKDPVGVAHFASVFHNGAADYNTAGNRLGIRPVFAIC